MGRRRVFPKPIDKPERWLRLECYECGAPVGQPCNVENRYRITHVSRQDRTIMDYWVRYDEACMTVPCMNKGCAAPIGVRCRTDDGRMHTPRIKAAEATA